MKIFYWSDERLNIFMKSGNRAELKKQTQNEISDLSCNYSCLICFIVQNNVDIKNKVLKEEIISVL